MTCESQGMSEFIKQETIHKEKWLSLEKYTYKDPNGQERVWEVVERTTKSKQKDIGDAVGIVAILKRALHHDCILLVRQYRPPIKGYCIEFPAGLIDKNETPSEAAIRELKEETGYSGIIESVSPVVSLDPGLSASTIHLVNMRIDGDDSINRKPVSNPDDGEFIEVFVVPVNELRLRLDKYASKGDLIDARVYTYALLLDQQNHPTEL
ncbi:ADP-sugar pyrophosphatase-like [Antedon mediterranea]|uniref:ADP-sugar pyrophosphatase-like n=1 Tax=Antedon mediterranea TaxID=105859 RepID=UPI003AF72E08